jgi:hypothetical protein
MLSVAFFIVMLSFHMLNGIMLSVIMLSVIVLSVIMLSAIMLIVVVPTLLTVVRVIDYIVTNALA